MSYIISNRTKVINEGERRRSWYTRLINSFKFEIFLYSVSNLVLLYEERVKGEWRGRIERDNKGLLRQRETYKGGDDGGGGDGKGKGNEGRGKIFISID